MDAIGRRNGGSRPVEPQPEKSRRKTGDAVPRVVRAVGQAAYAGQLRDRRPFLYRNRKGELLMLWSSFGDRGYAIGVARSQSGEVAGPWLQMPEALFARDGGHGMLFRTFDGELLLSIHRPNVSPDERPRFFRVEEKADGSLCLVESRRNKPMKNNPFTIMTQEELFKKPGCSQQRSTGLFSRRAKYTTV